jgi:hypothetical protein
VQRWPSAQAGAALLRSDVAHRKKHKGKSALSSAFKLRSARKSRCSNSQSNATIDDAFVALVSLVLHRRGLNQETT